ncbi:2,3-bisphosphoglycerate-independent phosphoglycerate mutase [Nitrosophilus kaiyonis]|uniref:2,3-bisphosphoglycerate-independent phosphoglycerate mutase n=1 Tax=Nitrosophilus kaiyonis TaxID=2930200 RepID=UPI00249196AB|nr:2,3-bisphosphoglycerate-independent phosphoglycerate mutase [Nitrosophilus kaiyonis]
MNSKNVNKTVLVITDGIGYNPSKEYNAFENAKKEAYKYLFENVPYSLIKTYGMSVGLPEGQMGNSEVGHMTIGSGRILYQDLVRISLALEDGSFEKDETFQNLLKKSKRLHIVGLLSDGGVHSHIDHFIAIANIASKYKEVILHPITDGRDVDPKSALKYVKQLKDNVKNAQIASVSGRFYTMDRDKRWDRVEKGYRAIVEAKPKTKLSIEDYIKEQYDKNTTDEFIEPVAFDWYNGMEDNDGVLFINFRSDRMREIVRALGDEDFNEFERKKLNLNITTIVEYDETFPYPVIFKKTVPKNTLAEVISRAGFDQFHTAETEKYAHVTFFFNGGIEEPYINETRVLIPSPNVKTYDEKPQMSAPEVGKSVLKAMDEGYEFIVVNFANGDMVGHTGNYEAAIKAVEAVDKELMKIIKKAKDKEYNLVITSDHGNCEKMRDENGNILTNHTVGDVWCFVMADGVEEVKPGGLSNIAPTVLKLMGLEIPKEMDKPLI